MHDHFTQRPSLSTLSPIRAVRNDPFISTTFQTYTPPGSVLQSINRSQTTKFWNEDATPSRSTTQPYFQPLFPPSPTHSRQTNKENGTSIGSGYSPGKRKGRSDTVTSSSSTAAKRHKPSPSLPFDEKLKHFRNLLADWDLTLLQVRLGSSDTNVSGEEKLGAIRDFISEVGMTWSEVQQKMYEAPLAEEKLAWTPSDRARYRSRAAAMAKFLQGRTKWTVSHLLRSWIRHPYGRAHRTSEEMYSSEEQHPYTDIRPVRPALTSFAVQIVTQHLVQSAEKAVHPSAGLHVHIPSKRHPEKRHASNIDWYNLGSHTFSTVSNIHRQYQPLLRYLISRVASRLPFIPSHNGPQDKVTHVEGYRPLNVVVDDVVSKLAFSRSKFARLPAFLTGLFHFASNASNDTFRYESRVGNTPAYTTILRSLYGLSSQAAKYTEERCKDLGTVMWVVCDNVQHYHRRRKARIGLENVMNIGIAGTAFFKPLQHPEALDYDDKVKRRAASQRDRATVDSLLRFVDHDHEHRVFIYQWLWVLGEYVPEFAELKKHALMKFRTQGKILKVDDIRTEASPLPSTSGAETDFNAFLSSVLDLMKSTGQTKENFIRRMFPLGGDGLTFELLLKLLQQRQFHPSEFTSFQILNPLLLWWHALWTNISRIIERHLVSYASLDPSTLGHSASKINRTIRIDQGKFDFHQGSELVYFVLDMRMLDCWRLALLHVAKEAELVSPPDVDIYEVVALLAAAKKLPEVEDFEKLARALHEAYSTEEAIYRSAHGLISAEAKFPPRTTSAPSALSPASELVPPPPGSAILAALDAIPAIPAAPELALPSAVAVPPAIFPDIEADTSTVAVPSSGEPAGAISPPVIPAPPSDTAPFPSLSQSQTVPVAPKKSKKPVPKPPSPLADSILARSQDFMRESIRSREASWASAEGDVGRVWAQLKVMLFSFAGTSHKKYAQYLLETLFDLELESSPELRDTLLEISHVSLSGLPGKHKPGDLVQEYFNRILEAIVQHKGREYGDRFIREGISRNLHHFQRLKTEFLDGVGLARHSSKHAQPHSKPEVKILLQEYRQQNLHLYSAGRMMGKEPEVVATHFKLGCQAMRGGLLKKWTTKMMFMKGRGSDVGEAVDEEEEEEELNIDMSSAPLCAMDMVDGRLESRLLDPEQDALNLIAIMESSRQQADDSEDEDDDIAMMAASGFDTDDEDFPELP